MSNTLLCLTDNIGLQLSNDDVIYDGKDYYRIYKNGNDEFEMLSCTNGYKHNIQPKDLASFERIGTYAENEHLFICD